MPLYTGENSESQERKASRSRSFPKHSILTLYYGLLTSAWVTITSLLLTSKVLLNTLTFVTRSLGRYVKMI